MRLPFFVMPPGFAGRGHIEATSLSFLSHCSIFEQQDRVRGWG